MFRQGKKTEMTESRQRELDKKRRHKQWMQIQEDIENELERKLKEKQEITFTFEKPFKVGVGPLPKSIFNRKITGVYGFSHHGKDIIEESRDKRIWIYKYDKFDIKGVKRGSKEDKIIHEQMIKQGLIGEKCYFAVAFDENELGNFLIASTPLPELPQKIIKIKSKESHEGFIKFFEMDLFIEQSIKDHYAKQEKELQRISKMVESMAPSSSSRSSTSSGGKKTKRNKTKRKNKTKKYT